MARAKSEPVKEVQLPALDAETLAANQNIMATIQAAYGEERDLVNQLLGQAQMAGALSDFSRTVRTSKLAHVKENKLYRALKGKKSTHGATFSGTWEDFCDQLGISHDQANRDIDNLRAFGEEALESMSRMGIGYREMRQYRLLPEDQKSALIEIAKAGDKEAFIDLAEEIITKHAKEKAVLNHKLDEINANYQAQSAVMATKNSELDSAKLELTKSRKRIQSMSEDDVAKELRQEVTGIAYKAESCILGELRYGFSKLQQHADKTGEDQRSFQAGLVRQLELVLATVRSEFYLTDSLDDNPNWLKQSDS